MENNLNLFNGLGIEIELPTEDNFLKVRETLTRMGVASKKTNTLFQSCHILHKRGKYAIMHFKELFKLDGKSSNLDSTDIARRNTIVKLLEEWKLVIVKSDIRTEEHNSAHVKIIPYSEKEQWELKAKYSIGKKKV